MFIDIIWKTVAIYFISMAVIKFMGKREIGQLSIFDFAVLLIIADILVSSIDDKDIYFLYYAVAIIILSIIQKGLAFVMLKSAKIRNQIEGKPSIMIVDGKLQIEEMRKQNYNIDDLIVQLRLKNTRSISEVRYAILETNGELSVFLCDDFPSTSTSGSQESPRGDFSVKAKTFDALPGAASSDATSTQAKEIYPFPLIVSGVLLEDHLQILNVKRSWLEEELTKKHLCIEDVLYANYENESLFVIESKQAKRL